MPHRRPFGLCPLHHHPGNGHHQQAIPHVRHHHPVKQDKEGSHQGVGVHRSVSGQGVHICDHAQRPGQPVVFQLHRYIRILLPHWIGRLIGTGIFLQGFFQLGPVLLRHPALQIEGLAGIQQPSPGFLSVTLHLGQVSQLLKLGPEVSHGGQFLLQLGQLFGQLLQLPVQPDRVFCRRPRPIPQIGTGPAQSLQRL